MARRAARARAGRSSSPRARRARPRRWPASPCRRSRRPCAALHDHLVARQAEHARDDLLHLGRVLRRRVRPARSPSSSRLGQRGLRLEVEVLLPADVQLALEACGASRSAASASPRCMPLGVGEEAAGGDGVLDREDRRQRLVLDLHRGRGETRGLFASRRPPSATAWPSKQTSDGNSGSSWRAGPMSFSPGTSSAVSTASTPGALRARRGVDRQDARVRVRRLHRPRMGDVRHVGPQIVDVARRAGDVAGRDSCGRLAPTTGAVAIGPTGWFIGPPPPARLRPPCRPRTSRAAGRSARADTRRCRAGRSSACRRRRRSTAAPPPSPASTACRQRAPRGRRPHGVAATPP